MSAAASARVHDKVAGIRACVRAPAQTRDPTHAFAARCTKPRTRTTSRRTPMRLPQPAHIHTLCDPPTAHEHARVHGARVNVNAKRRAQITHNLVAAKITRTSQPRGSRRRPLCGSAGAPAAPACGAAETCGRRARCCPPAAPTGIQCGPPQTPAPACVQGFSAGNRRGGVRGRRSGREVCWRWPRQREPWGFQRESFADEDENRQDHP